MLTQYFNGVDKIVTFVGKDFEGVGGSMAAQAMHTWEELVGNELDAPKGINDKPRLIKMIKWKVLYKEYAS